MLEKVFQLFSKKDSKFVIKIQVFYFLIAIIEILSISSIAPLTYSVFNPNLESLNNKFSKYLIFNNFEKVSHYQIFFVSIFCSLIVIYNMMLILVSKVNENLVKKTCIHLYKKTIQNFFNDNLNDFSKKNNSEYVNQMTFDIQNISVQILSNFLKANLKIYSILTIFFLIIYIDFVNALILMITALISYFIIFKNIKKYIASSGKSATVVNSDILRMLKEIFQNFETISLHDNFKYVFNNIIKNITLFSHAKKNIEIIYVLTRCSIEILAAFIFSFLILFSISNYTLIEYLPILTFYFFAFYRLFPNLQQFFLSYSIMNTWNYSLDKILKNIKNDNKNKLSDIHSQIEFKKNIKIKNLFFNRGDKIIFSNFNCEMKKNSIIGINGKSGSGKTTLIKIISGIIKNFSGSLEIDNKKLSDQEIFSWQKNIGYVSQYNFLVLDSIINNITMSNETNEVDFKFLNQIIKIVELDKIYSEEQLLNDQIIGEDSLKISGGQKQRIAIARALYRNPKLLILDESFNSLDMVAENKIMMNIKKIFSDITIIIISHREESLKICDTKIQLD